MMETVFNYNRVTSKKFNVFPMKIGNNHELQPAL